MPRATFGRNLTRAREAAGLSQQALADAADLWQPQIAYWERDQREPTLAQLRTLARVLKATIHIDRRGHVSFDTNGGGA